MGGAVTELGGILKRTINIQGESYRLRQHRKAGLPIAWDRPEENKTGWACREVSNLRR